MENLAEKPTQLSKGDKQRETAGWNTELGAQRAIELSEEEEKLIS